MKELVQNPKSENKNYNNVLANRPRPYFQEIIKNDKLKAPSVLNEESCPYIDDNDINRERYFSLDFHKLEIENVWKKVWQFTCREEDIPLPGDYYVYDIVDQSVLIVRTEKGDIKAYYNSCLHRGTQLKPSNSCGFSKILKCPFHGWSWSLDGNLKNIPCEWDFPHVNKKEFKLPEIKIDTWGGFIFINFNKNSISLKEYLSVLPDHFKDWDMKNRRKAGACS